MKGSYSLCSAPRARDRDANGPQKTDHPAPPKSRADAAQVRAQSPYQHQERGTNSC